ncbi:zinc-binding dehydrogenase [Streptomyces sp. NBC_01367]|uniref:zinc-binding dehydrogenase n=1 Tax=Streptomyces sp. NBC_01367 TaxID=2903841 RepID=UPI0032513A48
MRFVEYYLEPTPADLAGFADLVDSAGIRPFVEKTRPLADATKAHRLSENGRVRGKIVLAPDAPYVDRTTGARRSPRSMRQPRHGPEQHPFGDCERLGQPGRIQERGLASGADQDPGQLRASTGPLKADAFILPGQEQCGACTTSTRRTFIAAIPRRQLGSSRAPSRAPGRGIPLPKSAPERHPPTTDPSR